MSRSGQLLVATPALADPNFARTVVLIVEDDAEGSMGVVLNRPTAHRVSASLPLAAGLVDPPFVFSGGPVQPDHGLALASGVGPFSIATPIGDGRVGLVAPETENVDRIRFFAGYAGWMPGQLEGEIAEAGWWTVTATLRDIFTAEPDSLWRRVLERQPGNLSLVASYPDDPSLN